MGTSSVPLYDLELGRGRMACRSAIGGHSATGEIPRHFTAQITLLIVETITKMLR